MLRSVRKFRRTVVSDIRWTIENIPNEIAKVRVDIATVNVKRKTDYSLAMHNKVKRKREKC